MEFFDLLDFVLSLARALCGVGIVLMAVLVGRWAFMNPQPTWAAVWRHMPKGMRGLTISMVVVFLGSHAVLVTREFWPEPPKPVEKHVPVAE